MLSRLLIPNMLYEEKTRMAERKQSRRSFLQLADLKLFAGIVSFEYEKDVNDPLAGLAESTDYVRGALDTI
jgi:hypothetical protein